MKYHEYIFVVLLMMTLTAMIAPTYGPTLLIVVCGLLLVAIRYENTSVK